MIVLVTSTTPSIKENESPVDGFEAIVNSVPFTDATDVGVAIRNSFPFCGAISAVIFPYFISKDLLILFPVRFPAIVKSELAKSFRTVLSSKYITAAKPPFPVRILS